MQAVLNVAPNKIDETLLNVLRELLSKDVEVTLRNTVPALEEFDSSVPLDEVMADFENEGYSEDLLRDLRAGFESSGIYAR